MSKENYKITQRIILNLFFFIFFSKCNNDMRTEQNRKNYLNFLRNDIFFRTAFVRVPKEKLVSSCNRSRLLYYANLCLENFCLNCVRLHVKIKIALLNERRIKEIDFLFKTVVQNFKTKKKANFISLVEERDGVSLLHVFSVEYLHVSK